MSGWFGLLGLPTLARVAAGVVDTFTRADSNTSLGDADTGQTWEAIAGTWGIASNKGRLVSAPNGAIAVVDAEMADGTFKVTVDIPDPLPDDWGICFRVVDADNYWCLIYGWGEAHVAAWVDGEHIGEADFVWTPSASTPYELKVVLLGDSLTFYVDDVEKASVTSEAHKTATKHGLFGMATAVRFDDLFIQSES